MGYMAEPPFDATEVRDEVQRLLARDDPAGAAELLRRFADTGPLDRHAALFANRLGRRLTRLGDQEHARAVFLAAYESGHGPTAALAALRLAQQAQQSGDLDAAEAWYQRAIRQENGGSAAAGAATLLGAMRHKSGDLDAARALFRQALDLADERAVPTIAFTIGDLLRRRSAFADAEPMLRRAIEAGHPKARQALGRVLLGLGRPDEAMAALREAADRDGDFGALEVLGNVLVNRVDPGADLAELFAHGNPADVVHGYFEHLPDGPEIDEAEQCYRRAAEAGVESALVRLGHLLMGTGRIAEAEIVLRRAVRGDVPDAAAALGALLRFRGEDDEAARVIGPAAAANNLRSLILQADLDGQHGRHAEAAAVLRRALPLGGAPLGAGGMLFINQMMSAEPAGAAEETLRQMLATDDRTGLAMLEWLVSDEPGGPDRFRHMCEAHDDAAVHRFVAFVSRSLRE